MKIMARLSRKPFITLVFASLLFYSLSAQEAKRLVILHTNDIHSRLDGYSPSSEYSPLSLNNDKTIGGFSRLATMIRKQKKQNPQTTIVVDAGDFLMGTFFHYMEEYEAFQLPLMKEMGYEVVALGNHEFDFGPKRLAGIINKSRNKGEIPELLLSNIVFDHDEDADNDLEKIYREGAISSTTIIEKGGLKLGLFSLMGIDASDVAPNANPVEFSKQTKIARELAKDLKAQGCDIIICLSHSGVEKDKNGNWAGEDVALAEKVKDLDIIVSGHTHTLLEKPIMVNGKPIVQTGSFGAYLGRLEVELKGDDLKVISYDLLAIDDSVLGDKDIQEKIDNQKARISEKLLKPLNYTIDQSVVEAKFNLVCDEQAVLEESNLGPLIADAIYKYVDSNVADGTDISIVAAGVIRDRIVPGVQTLQDVFRVMSLGSGKDEVPGYPLSTVYVTGKELKNIFEILLVAYKSSPSNYCYYSGIEVKYNPDKGLLRKIDSIFIFDNAGNLKYVDTSKKNEDLYSISANSYLLKFVGIIQKMTFGLVKVKPKDREGNELIDMSAAIIDFDPVMDGVQEGKEWIALIKYLESMKDANSDSISDMDEKYKKPVSNIHPVKN